MKITHHVCTLSGGAVPSWLFPFVGSAATSSSMSSSLSMSSSSTWDATGAAGVSTDSMGSPLRSLSSAPSRSCNQQARQLSGPNCNAFSTSQAAGYHLLQVPLLYTRKHAYHGMDRQTQAVNSVPYLDHALHSAHTDAPQRSPQDGNMCQECRRTCTVPCQDLSAQDGPVDSHTQARQRTRRESQCTAPNPKRLLYIRAESSTGQCIRCKDISADFQLVGSTASPEMSPVHRDSWRLIEVVPAGRMS